MNKLKHAKQIRRQPGAVRAHNYAPELQGRGAPPQPLRIAGGRAPPGSIRPGLLDQPEWVMPTTNRHIWIASAHCLIMPARGRAGASQHCALGRRWYQNRAAPTAPFAQPAPHAADLGDRRAPPKASPAGSGEPALFIAGTYPQRCMWPKDTAPCGTAIPSTDAHAHRQCQCALQWCWALHFLCGCGAAICNRILCMRHVLCTSNLLTNASNREP